MSKKIIIDDYFTEITDGGGGTIGYRAIYDNTNKLVKHIVELNKEFELLEKINKENQEKIKRQNKLLEENDIAKQYGDEALFFELEDYKQAIDRIKEIIKQQNADTRVPFNRQTAIRMDYMLQIINEVEE